jgi:serine/threonine protein phosphatase PrpC
VPQTLPRPEIRFDVASAMSQGRRDYQEDALATDFPSDTTIGFAVLADGMGGHVAGDVASRIAVTQMFDDLKLRLAAPTDFTADVPGALMAAVGSANLVLGAHSAAHPDASGMGATVVGLVFVGDAFYWISVGDSPLYLYRDGKLSQLNEDHSLAPQIDFLVREGMMDPEVGRHHPDRHCLTSVLIGGEIERIDCVAAPFQLKAGDLVIVASDGLQTLDDGQIEALLARSRGRTSSEIAETLLAAVERCADPEQDNVSLSVIQPQYETVKRRRGMAGRTPSRLHEAALALTGLDRDSAAARWLRGEGRGLLFRRRSSGESPNP